MDLNLSSEPFRNRSLFWIGIGFAYVLAVTALLIVIGRAGAVDADSGLLAEEAEKQHKTIADLEKQLSDIKDEKSRAVMGDDDRLALDEARLLINQKSVSWSRLFDQLEPYVPERTRLTSITMTGLEGTGDRRVVSIEVMAEAKDYGQMAEFIQKLDGSGGRFDADPVEIAPVDESTDFTFTVTIRYRPGVRAAEVSEGNDG